MFINTYDDDDAIQVAIHDSMHSEYINPLNQEIGGTHYRECAIQPVEFIEANKLGFLEGCVVKRIVRHNKATGKGAQDIRKIIHECELLLKLRYADDSN
jgi:hypothetical protein